MALIYPSLPGIPSCFKTRQGLSRWSQTFRTVIFTVLLGKYSYLVKSAKSCRAWKTFLYQDSSQANKLTCLINCLSLLIWETQPKTNMVADREPIVHLTDWEHMSSCACTCIMNQRQATNCTHLTHVPHIFSVLLLCKRRDCLGSFVKGRIIYFYIMCQHLLTSTINIFVNGLSSLI